MFSDSRKKCSITEKKLKYFTCEYKKTTNFSKRLPKSHKRLFNVPGRPVISNFDNPTKKFLEFLYYHLKPVMQNSWSYLKSSGYFLKKMKNSISEDTFLVTADIVSFNSSIPHTADLAALRNALENREVKKISREDLVKMAEFLLKNNHFEFNRGIKHQLSGTAIGTKFAPLYACIFMDKHETNFLKTQLLSPLVWFTYIDNVSFLWTYGEQNLKPFLGNLSNYDPYIRFNHEYSKKGILFFNLKVSIKNGNINTDLYVKDTGRDQYLSYTSAHPYHTKRSVVFNHALRLSCLCTFEKDFERHMTGKKQWFAKRDYPQDLINSEMIKVIIPYVKQKYNNNKEKGIRFAVTFHPLPKSLGNILNKNYYLIQLNHEVKKFFTFRSKILFRSARKLNSYLVWA